MQTDPGFDAALASVANVEGWMTDAQARRLWERARDVAAPGQIVEIGSYRGRSAVVLAKAAPEGVTVTAIDPHAGNDRGPQQIHGDAAEGQGDHVAFMANLERAGVGERVRHIRLPSQDALGEVAGGVALAYVDGAHRYRPARDDIAKWGARVEPDGTLLIHDSFSSIGVTLAIARLLFLGRDFRYAGRTGSLAEYRREPVRGRDRALNAARQVAEIPWFARNVLVKVALVTRLRPLARLLGHRSGDWPY
ncbi:MAG TPA: class I SAM-dependent methyltransferase [Thermoleophilaceae bacterium]|nr:class I SAM-dependent methyltransferase [Thermoleophilaceae bacterium]